MGFLLYVINYYNLYEWFGVYIDSVTSVRYVHFIDNDRCVSIQQQILQKNCITIKRTETR